MVKVVAVTDVLDKLDELCDALQTALINGDAHAVEKLVTEQCECIAQIPADGVSTAHQIRLKRLRERVQTQQVLISQALGVTQFFLESIYRHTSFSTLV